MILAEISGTRRNDYTETSFCHLIALLGIFCQAYAVPMGQYGPFCDAKCPRLQRNVVLYMLESFSEWLGHSKSGKGHPINFVIANFTVVAVEPGISNNLVIFQYFA